MAVPVQALATCDLFVDFTETGLSLIAGIARFREVPAGLSIFLQGAPGESMFVLDHGTVEISDGLLEGGRLLCVLEQGEHFGELALLRPGRRAVNARAREACRLVEIRRADFNDLLQRKPRACVKLMLAIFATVERRLDAVRGDLGRLLD